MRAAWLGGGDPVTQPVVGTCLSWGGGNASFSSSWCFGDVILAGWVGEMIPHLPKTEGKTGFLAIITEVWR